MPCRLVLYLYPFPITLRNTKIQEYQQLSLPVPRRMEGA
jgi:hypothetical protein